jgi:Tol biopolymer transport system component
MENGLRFQRRNPPASASCGRMARAVHMLTTETLSGYRFAWSPDGTRIACRTAQRDKGPRQYLIRVINVASGATESSTEVIAEAQPPTWQRGPEGERWVSHAPTGPLEGAWRASTQRAAQIGPPLLIQREREVWLHDADPAKRRKLSTDFGINPAWSPDGATFVYDALDRFVVASPESGTHAPIVGLHPAWSPDGRWIIYQLTRDHSHAADDPRRHTADTLPHVHDDKTNHRIVDSELWIITADGTGRHQLTNTPDVLETDPDWSPDGTTIACRTEDTGRLLLLQITK